MKLGVWENAVLQLKNLNKMKERGENKAVFTIYGWEDQMHLFEIDIQVFITVVQWNIHDYECREHMYRMWKNMRRFIIHLSLWKDSMFAVKNICQNMSAFGFLESGFYTSLLS